MPGTLTQAEARQHKLQAARGNMRSLDILLEHLLGGDITLDNLEVATLTIDAVVGGDASLGITGEAAAQGGAIVITGGTSSTAGNVGGVVQIVGGTPGATSAGAAVSITGGIGGATSGAGGGASVVGGAGTAINNDGGAVTITGGGVIASTTTTAGADSGGIAISTPDGALAITGVGGSAGDITITAGAGGKVDDDEDTNAAGVGGDVILTAGVGGVHDLGTGLGGAGGNVQLLAGAGGADAEASQSTGGIGGNCIIGAGAGGAGNATGAGGELRLIASANTPPLFGGMAVVTDSTSVTSATVAEILSTVHLKDPGGAINWQWPNGTDLAAGFPITPVAGDYFYFTLINTDATNDADITVTVDTGVTFKGSVVVTPLADDAGDAGERGAATWLVRCISANVWVAYRIN